MKASIPTIAFLLLLAGCHTTPAVEARPELQETPKSSSSTKTNSNSEADSHDSDGPIESESSEESRQQHAYEKALAEEERRKKETLRKQLNKGWITTDFVVDGPCSVEEVSSSLASRMSSIIYMRNSAYSKDPHAKVHLEAKFRVPSDGRADDIVVRLVDATNSRIGGRLRIGMDTTIGAAFFGRRDEPCNVEADIRFDMTQWGSFPRF